MPEPLFSFTWEGIGVGVNDRYAHRSSKKLTAEYQAFKEDISWTCRAANVGKHISERIMLHIEMLIDPARDSDSLLKPLFDGIELSAVIDNDRQIRSYHVYTHDKPRALMDRIEVKAYLA